MSQGRFSRNFAYKLTGCTMSGKEWIKRESRYYLASLQMPSRMGNEWFRCEFRSFELWNDLRNIWAAISLLKHTSLTRLLLSIGRLMLEDGPWYKLRWFYVNFDKLTEIICFHVELHELSEFWWWWSWRTWMLRTTLISVMPEQRVRNFEKNQASRLMCRLRLGLSW